MDIPNKIEVSERHLGAQGRGQIRCRNVQRSLLPQNAREDCVRKFGGAAVSTRRALPALPGLGPRHLGAEEDRPSGQIDVRSPHRRLTP